MDDDKFNRWRPVFYGAFAFAVCFCLTQAWALTIKVHDLKQSWDAEEDCAARRGKVIRVVGPDRMVLCYVDKLP